MNNKRKLCLQGNLDPSVLLEGGEKMINKVNELLLACSNINHIFNLGHGIIKETPIRNVEMLIKTVRNWKMYPIGTGRIFQAVWGAMHQKGC